MSIKDAVAALRSLKLELEATRRSKAELEATRSVLTEELRRSRQEVAALKHSSAAQVGDGKPSATHENGSPVEHHDGVSTSEKLRAAREERLRKDLLEAKSSLAQTKEQRGILEMEAKNLREQLAAMKSQSEEATANLQRKLNAAEEARNDLTESSKGSENRIQEARDYAIRQEIRAVKAEAELASSLEGAAGLRSSVENLKNELERAESSPAAAGTKVLCAVGDTVEEGRNESELVLEGAPELSKTETCATGDASQPQSKSQPGPVEDVEAMMPDGKNDAIQHEAQKLRAELERVIADNLELVSIAENTQKDAAEAAEAATTARSVLKAEIASAKECLAQKERAIELLRSRLMTADREREDVKRAASSEAQKREEEVASYKAFMARAVEGREEAERIAADVKTRCEDEISSVRRKLEEVEAMKDREIAKKRAELAEKQEELASKELEIIEKTARMDAEREEAKAEATAAVAAAIVETTAAEQTNAKRTWRDKIADMSQSLKDLKEERDALRKAAEDEKGRSANVCTQAAEDLQTAQKARQVAEKLAKALMARATAGETKIARQQSEVQKAERDKLAAEQARYLAEQERDAARANAEESLASRESMAEVLLSSNAEILSLKHARSAAEASVEDFRSSAGELEESLKYVESKSRDDAVRAAKAADEAQQEMKRLRERIQHMEQVEVLRRCGRCNGDCFEKPRAGEGSQQAVSGIGEAEVNTEDGEQDRRPREGEVLREGTQSVLEERDRLRSELTRVRQEADNGEREVEQNLQIVTEERDLLRSQLTRVRQEAANREHEVEETLQSVIEERDRLRNDLMNVERDTDSGESDAEETMQSVIKERDRLRSELIKVQQEAATRVAGLETQLADTEREAADTQRRLYRQQTELEVELEELRTSHDSLRIEIARMDATLQDAAEAADRNSSLVSRRSGTAVSNVMTTDGDVARDGKHSTGSRGKRNAEEIGAEIGGAVGGILRGKFWTGWNASPGKGASSATKEQQGEATKMSGKTVGSSTERHMGGAREGQQGRKMDAGNDARSLSRVRDTMMTRLQEASSRPGVDRSAENGDSEGDRSGRTTMDATRSDDALALASQEDDGQGAFIGSSTPGEGRGEDGDSERSGREGEGEAERLQMDEEDGWLEETVEHPAPDYGMNSPVIRYLLRQWSSDPDKLKYLTLWLRCVIERRKVPEAFPSGLQLIGLAPEVKDGLLTLVVPLIRHRGRLPVVVHSRVSPPDGEADERESAEPGEEQRWDLRIKVDLQSASAMGLSPHKTGAAGSGQHEHRRRGDTGEAGNSAGDSLEGRLVDGDVPGNVEHQRSSRRQQKQKQKQQRDGGAGGTPKQRGFR